MKYKRRKSRGKKNRAMNPRKNPIVRRTRVGYRF